MLARQLRQGTPVSVVGAHVHAVAAVTVVVRSCIMLDFVRRLHRCSAQNSSRSKLTNLVADGNGASDGCCACPLAYPLLMH